MTVTKLQTLGSSDDTPPTSLSFGIKEVPLNGKIKGSDQITIPKHKRLKERVQEKRSLIQLRLKQQTRKVNEKILRQTENVKNKMSVEHVVKFLDKTGFMLGVLGLVFTELVFLSFPKYFWIYYTLTYPPLMIHRWITYRRSKWEYFLIDFCYFEQIMLLINIFIFPKSPLFWQVQFLCSNGPLLTAIPAWQNSLVFHSLGRTTSIFIHLFPALLTFIQRWHTNDMCMDEQCSLSWSTTLYYAMLQYAIWQLLYIIKTDIIDYKKLRNDKGLITSVRWLANDKNNIMTIVVCAIVHKLGIIPHGNEIDPDSIKTKIVFWLAQFAYTFLTIVPALFMFDNIVVHSLLLGLCFASSIWNGANYYIEVFSKKYATKFENLPRQDQKSADPWKKCNFYDY